MPYDLVRCSFIQAKPKRWLVLPHLAGHIVSAAQLVREALAICIQNQATNASKRLSCQELDLRIRIIWFHQASRMDLDPLEVNRFPTDCLTHLDSIACAMLAIRGRQVHQIGTVLRKERVLSEISSKSTRAENYGPHLIEIRSTLLVH